MERQVFLRMELVKALLMCNVYLLAFPKGTHYHFVWVNTLGKLHKHLGNSWTLAVIYCYVPLTVFLSMCQSGSVW